MQEFDEYYYSKFEAWVAEIGDPNGLRNDGGCYGDE
jgi:hypothetical protein